MSALRGQARLADIQAQQAEVGRIRLGTSTPKVARSGRSYNEPVKLDRFRLTSRSRALIEQAAHIYGGEPGEWTPQNGGAPQWEVIIERDWLGVIVPPNSCSQYYEQWAGGRCQVRCNGVRELLSEEPCVCGPDPQQRKCKPYTRLSVMLSELPGIGVWRLETHGYNAAAELPAVADLLSAAGGNIPARLEMEERSAEVPDPKNAEKTVITRFMVPVLHVEATPAQIMAAYTPNLALGTGDGSQPTALPAAAPLPAIGAGPAPEPAQGAAKDALLNTLVATYRRQIARAGDMATLTTIRDAIRRDVEKFETSPEMLAELRQTWTSRFEFLSDAGPASAPSPPPAAPTPPPPTSPEPVDRQRAWMDLNTWAGYNNLTLSGLKERYGVFKPGADIKTATGEELVAFGEYLKAGSS